MLSRTLLPTILALVLALPSQAQDAKSVHPLPSTADRPPSAVTRAVVIGISDYQDPDIPDLHFADKDAEAFANFLRSPAGGALDKDHLQVLTNQQATSGLVASAFDWLLEQSKADDNVIIYFSGHGDVERKTISQPGFLLCWDSPARVYMGGGTYSLAFLQEIITTLSTQNKAKVLFIADACHAGKLAGSQIGGAQATTANLAKQFSNEVKILSCQPDEFSLEGEQWGGGRGVFSYHLLDALCGMADKNADASVSLFELNRYLEDHVTAEAAPQNQIPMVVGNKAAQIALVDTAFLAQLLKSRSGRVIIFAPTEGRGLEDIVLAAVDSNLRQLYFAFNKALQEKRLLEPAGNCAEELYNTLSTAPGLARLHGYLKRKYAAALQDDAQQAMNIWLKADVQQLDCIGKSLRLEPIPRLLERAAALLGKEHYMYSSLLSRKLLFEGILLSLKNQNPDERLARQCLALYHQAMKLEPQSPLAWYQMSQTYLKNLRQPDSAFVCAKEAFRLVPNWVLPFTDMAYLLISYRNFGRAKLALQLAESIDSLHPYVLNRWALWYKNQNERSNKEKALILFEKYRDGGGALYPCWHNDYGLTLKFLGRSVEAEREFRQTIAMDSINISAWANLGSLYSGAGRFPEAEQILKKALALDSTYTEAWNSLGLLYIRTGRYPEAEQILTKAVALDSTFSPAQATLGYFYLSTYNFAAAEPVLKKAISMDSTLVEAWSNLGVLYDYTGRYAESEPVFKKAVALDSTLAYVWNELGGLYLDIPNYDKAVVVYKKAVALDSTDAGFRNNLGLSYLQNGQYSEAEAALKKAISMNPDMANAHKHLAMVCFKTGRGEEARTELLNAIQLNPNYTPALLGMAYVLAAGSPDSDPSKQEAITKEALEYVERAIGKGARLQQLENDPDLAPLRAQTGPWQALMKKHFPDKSKD